MVTDGHNHTCLFSPDATQTPEELISAAYRRGLPGICITEHYELDNPDKDDEVQTFNLKNYASAFEQWRSFCPKDFNLLMGIEFGYQSHTADAIEKLTHELDFDVVLLSNHLFRGADPYYSTECYKVPVKERHNEYISTMAEMCERVDNFDVAAHYDYINRYNPTPESYVLYDDCPKAFDRLFEALITKNKSLEVNTRSVMKLAKNGAKQIMPDARILQRYSDMGGKLISLGSDSHTQDTLGIYFEETSEYLKSLGFTEAVYYKKHEPISESL